MVTLVDEQIHESIIRFHHDFDFAKVLLLQEIDFPSIILRECADLCLTWCDSLTLEEDRIGFRAYLCPDIAFVDESADEFKSFLFAHIETFHLVKF